MSSSGSFPALLSDCCVCTFSIAPPPSLPHKKNERLDFKKDLPLPNPNPSKYRYQK